MIAGRKPKARGPKSYVYFGNCISLPAGAVQRMSNVRLEIAARTFFLYVDKAEVDNMMGYSKTSKPASISGDPCVRFYRSRYQNQPCYYFDHSATYYIYLPKEA